jgi:hypothetical protein
MRCKLTVSGLYDASTKNPRRSPTRPPPSPPPKAELETLQRPRLWSHRCRPCSRAHCIRTSKGVPSPFYPNGSQVALLDLVVNNPNNPLPGGPANYGTLNNSVILRLPPSTVPRYTFADTAFKLFGLRWTKPMDWSEAAQFFEARNALDTRRGPPPQH